MTGNLGGRRLRCALGAALLSSTLVGCSSADGEGDALAAGPTEPTSDDATEEAAPTAESLWAEGLATQNEPIGYRTAIYARGVPLQNTNGSWTSDPMAWDSTTTAVDPTTGSEYVFYARSDAKNAWMQLEGVPGPAAGCWLTIEDSVADGLPSYTAGKPRDLTILDHFKPAVLKDGGVLVGTGRLEDALGLLNSPTLDVLGYESLESVRGQVSMKVYIAGPGIDSYEILGSDIANAVRRNGGVVPEDAAEGIESLNVSSQLYNYDGPPDDAPAPASIVTKAELDAGAGCQTPEPN